MDDKKLEIERIEEKIEIDNIELQGDPCHNDPWSGIYDCLRDCSGGTSPKQSPAY